MTTARSRFAVVALLAGLALALPVLLSVDRAAAASDGIVLAQADPQPDERPTPPAPDEPIVESPDGVPDINVQFEGEEDQGLTRTVMIVLLIGVSALAPALVLLMTTFTRFIVVLGLSKQALALQTVPPAQVLIGLALFLTAFVMGPVFSQVNEDAVQPFLAGEIEQGEAVELAWTPVQDFMLAQTREDDLNLFVNLSGNEAPASPQEVGATTLIPAFVISELRAAFIIGFVVFVPFLLIDLVVAAVLMSMGMVMVPPVFISLPLKLLLFVLVDGWVLMIGSMVQSVQAVT